MARALIRDESPGPVNPSDRIDSIDALRGVALLGVLAINLVMEFRVSIFEQFLPAARPAPPLDRAVETALMLAVDLKAFALFSLLFGVGLAIQFEHLSACPRRALLFSPPDRLADLRIDPPVFDLERRHSHRICG